MDPHAISTSVQADLEIQFAGQTAHYEKVLLKLTKEGSEIDLSATIPATLSDFKIDPPTLVTVPVKNEIPVRVEMTWRPQ